MKLVFPKLELQSGTTLCLHIPPGCHEQEALIEEAILHAASQQGKPASICRFAHQPSGVSRFFGHVKSVDWLAGQAHVSKSEAAKMISEFGIPVMEELRRNPGTPRCLLGIAAALAGKPHVVAYSTSGLDPQGRHHVHQYIACKRHLTCFIHISWPSFHGNGKPAARSCPEGICVLMLEDNS